MNRATAVSLAVIVSISVVSRQVVENRPQRSEFPVVSAQTLTGMSQNDLSKSTGIPQSRLSAIENDRVYLGVERAKVIARALKCHPAVLVFPGWELGTGTAA